MLPGCLDMYIFSKPFGIIKIERFHYSNQTMHVYAYIPDMHDKKDKLNAINKVIKIQH